MMLSRRRQRSGSQYFLKNSAVVVAGSKRVMAANTNPPLQKRSASGFEWRQRIAKPQLKVLYRPIPSIQTFGSTRMNRFGWEKS
jgi:hypothetical protein